MSAASAIPAPPPIAGPLIAVTTGLVSRGKISCRRVVSSARRATSGLSAPSALNSARSAPAQNAEPAPVSRITLTASSTSAARRPSSNASVSALLRAFRFSGRFMVSVRTAARSSISSSAMCPSPSCGFGDRAQRREARHRAVELGDKAPDQLARRHELVDQTRALANLDLAARHVAVERRQLERTRVVDRLEVGFGPAAPLRGVVLAGEIVPEDADRQLAAADERRARDVGLQRRRLVGGMQIRFRREQEPGAELHALGA